MAAPQKTLSSQMQQAAAFKTLPQYPATNARNYHGSLVGEVITVDPRHGSDFEYIYSPGGNGPRASEHFTVTADNQCVNADGSGARIIHFTDRHGNAYYGNATRFNVASGSGSSAPAAAAKTVQNKGNEPQVFHCDIMDVTRRFLR